MRRDDLLYGSHSAIQKAVRRGDLNLGRTAFDVMWPDKKHRNWLKWRLSTIVMEDSLPLVCELPTFFAEEKEQDNPELYWRRFVYRMIVSPANRDADALHYLAKNTRKNVDEHIELAETRFWFAKVKQAGGDPSAVVEDLYESLSEEVTLSLYQKAALRVLKKRTSMGGMLGDREMALAAMIVVARRNPTREAILDGVGEGVDAWMAQPENEGVMRPHPIALPWYVFDMHTAVGKIALSSFAKKQKMDRDSLFWMWFMTESAYMPNWHCRWSKVKKYPTIFESMWQPLAMKQSLSLNGSSARENMDLWKDEIQDSLKGLIEWLLKKREAGDR